MVTKIEEEDSLGYMCKRKNWSGRYHPSYTNKQPPVLGKWQGSRTSSHDPFVLTLFILDKLAIRGALIAYEYAHALVVFLKNADKAGR